MLNYFKYVQTLTCLIYHLKVQSVRFSVFLAVRSFCNQLNTPHLIEKTVVVVKPAEKHNRPNLQRVFCLSILDY